MRLLLLFFLSFAIPVSGFPATPKNDVLKKIVLVNADTARINVRNFDLQKIASLKQQKAFIYDDVPPPQQSLWDRFWAWVWEIIMRIFSNETSGGVIKYAVVSILVAGIVFAVVKLVGADLAWFSKKPKAIEIPYTEGEENIHEINFSDEIARVVNQGNYRLAVRLFYLLSLKKLTDGGLIHWQPDKTNQTYLEELKDEDKKQKFSKLTWQFEYVWYGEFEVSRESFAGIRASFEQFNAHLS